MKKVFSNPNFIYIIAFIIPLLFYLLEWSTIFPKIRIGLLLFYISTFIVCIVFGIFLNKIKPFKYNSIAENRSNFSMLCFIGVIYFLEFLYSKNIPLLNVIRGNFDYGEDSFGIPVIHTLLVSFNSFFSIYLFHQFISLRRKKILVLFLFSFLPFVLLVYRSSILGVAFCCFFVFLLSRSKISINVVFKSVLGVLFFLFLFGFIGNFRSSGGDPTFIVRTSGGTNEFLESPVPKEFYWSYLYIASPVANLENNIDYTKRNEGSFPQLFVNECLPEFFGKFIPALHQNKVEFNQINSFLNVGTIYVFSFSYQRWIGIIFMFIYFFIFFNFYYLIIYKSREFQLSGLVILLNIIVFANFHNTISYSTSSLQLFYPVLFSLIKSNKIRNKLVNNIHV